MNFGTVQEILVQVKAKAGALGLLATDLVLDHAIYMKALEVLHNCKNAQLRDFINLRMGSFHAYNVFLAVIGKRFGSTGLRNLIVEARLASPDQVKGILKGKDYNYVICISKIAFEALLRLKFECFEKWLEKEGKSDALYHLRASDQFSKLMKYRNSETFRNGLKAVNITLHNYTRNLMIAFIKVI